MDMRTNLKVMIVVIALIECESAALLRTPKIYNALITTDQNLTPSRVFPVLQPTFHDSPFYYSPYGFNFGSYYDPYAFNPFEPAPPLVHKLNSNFDANDSSTEKNTTNTGAENVANDGNINNAQAAAKAPIPLNEFGFPQSLVRINPGKNAINLAPFPYNSYPLIYDQFNAYPRNVYLPHFGDVPPQPPGIYGSTRQFYRHRNQQDSAGSPNKNVNPNFIRNDSSNNRKLPGPNVGQSLGENSNIQNGNVPFGVNPSLLSGPTLNEQIGLNGNPALDGSGDDNTGFNGNPFLSNNAVTGNPFLGNRATGRLSQENSAYAPAENPFLGSAENSVGPKASVQPGREDSLFDGKKYNNNNGSSSIGRGASNPVFFDRENGVSQDQTAGVNGQNSFDGFDFFGDNIRKQTFNSNINDGNIGANSRPALDSDNWQGLGIGSQDSQANGFREESKSGSQSSQGNGSGFSRSATSFQKPKHDNRQNLSENRNNTNKNSALTRPTNENN